MVELGAVVTIIGVLAVVAVVAYRRTIISSHVAEATSMVGAIKAAEEARFAETGGYLSVSKGVGVGFYYPLANPTGTTKTAWGGTCSPSACNPGASWNQLAVTSNSPVFYGYAVVAGPPDSTPNGVTVPYQGKNLVWTNLQGGSTAYPNGWYVVEAQCDFDGNGVYSTVIGHSFGREILTDNDGE